MENKLGNYLKEKRKKEGMSLRDFADYLNISHTYLSKLENGCDPRTGKPVSPTIETLKQLSHSMGMTLEELLKISGYTEDKNIPTTFSTPQEAIEFIIKQPMVANFGGYDLDKMSDQEIMDMAEDVADMLRIMAKKHKK